MFYQPATVAVPNSKDGRIISIQCGADADSDDSILPSLSEPSDSALPREVSGNSENGNTGQQIESSTPFDTSGSEDSVVGSSRGQFVGIP